MPKMTAIALKIPLAKVFEFIRVNIVKSIVNLIDK